MNRSVADRVANALLYEGYILYPYRPSVKNRQRWTFGGLYPESYSRQGGSEPSFNQTECLVRGHANTTIQIVVRFLQITFRQVGAIEPPRLAWNDRKEFRPVEVLTVGEQIFHTWQEAEEREVTIDGQALGQIQDKPTQWNFLFPGKSWLQPLRENEQTLREEMSSSPERHFRSDHPQGRYVGVLAREQRKLEGAIELSAFPAGDNLYRIRVTVRNLCSERAPLDRDSALLRTLVSTHLLLGVNEGEFLSMTGEPDACREAVEECRNIGMWPVLIGNEGDRDTMLSSPIILYDYPRLAPESPGDLFDGTEIDEILSLRILTLTEDERRLAAAVDERARDLLARTEKLGSNELFGLHGTMRSLRPVSGAGNG